MLILLTAMVLVFTVLYFIVTARKGFAWQNTLFGELVIHLVENGKTDLLIHCLD